MYVHIAILLMFSSPSWSSQQQWTLSPNSIQSLFDDSTQNMNEFFQEKKKMVETLFSNSYSDAVKMTGSVNQYMEGQQKKIAAEVNSYVDTMKKSGRRMADTFSFVPENGPIRDEDRLDNPDVVLSVPAIIQRNGYLCETHTVTSKGYVLNIHRIPKSKEGGTIPLKTVILHHGLFASSADWILNGPDKALAYVLADAGYDVWMPNIRGNRYSREHTTLKTDSKSYWNFSWHDVALHDVPAIIDYIKKTKGSEAKIVYIGHSMGTTILFAMLSLRPEYSNTLTAGFALAPIVFMSDIKSPVKSLTPIASNVAYMEMLYGSHEFIPKNSALGSIIGSCNVDSIDGKVCKNVIFQLCGYNEAQFNKTLLPVFLAHIGTGTSWKTAVHFSQEIESGGKFQQFDYGYYYNKQVYGSEIPPEYDLGSITLPVKLFWSQNDLLSSEKDVRKLYAKLPAGTEIHMVPDPNFNHIDYLWAKDAPTLLNNKVLETLSRVFKKNDHAVRFSFKFGK